jgi:hypothetical protein
VTLTRSEVELINPRVSGVSYALLRTYRVREWHDQRGNWHVVVAAQHIPEIEQAELRQRRRGDQRKYVPGYEFQAELEKAQARLKAKERTFQQSLNPNR